jgi:hypothetical protein
MKGEAVTKPLFSLSSFLIRMITAPFHKLIEKAKISGHKPAFPVLPSLSQTKKKVSSSSAGAHELHNILPHSEYRYVLMKHYLSRHLMQSHQEHSRSASATHPGNKAA